MFNNSIGRDKLWWPLVSCCLALKHFSIEDWKSTFECLATHAMSQLSKIYGLTFWIPEWLEFEGTFKNHLVQLCHGQRHLSLDQVAQSPIQIDLKHRIYHSHKAVVFSDLFVQCLTVQIGSIPKMNDYSVLINWTFWVISW